MTRENRHTTHPGIVKRLKRADGHLHAVIAMIEDGRSCLEVTQQLQAVEKAIAGAKQALIHDHIDHCLDTDSDREELKAISKFL